MFLKKCRLRESKKLSKFLDFGFHPPADQFKKNRKINCFTEMPFSKRKVKVNH